MKSAKTLRKRVNRLTSSNRLKNRSNQLKDNKTNKAFAILGIAFLILQIFSSLFLPRPLGASADENLCSIEADAVLVMDTSGSMAEGEITSHCYWWNLELVDTTYQWVAHTTDNVDQDWCEAKSQPPDRVSAFTEGVPKKIDAAKEAAKSFIDKLQDNDQSAMVFFNGTSVLAKGLSSDHAATKATIDGLIPEGSTNIGDALASGIDELGSSRANPKANKVIILLTDGKANKPNGDGHDENPLDVAYAEKKAQQAAGLGYKIFTIGLGGDGEINETMLQNIASVTGAKYYHAPTSSDLSDIYNQIAFEVCQYGSISGCKFNDSNQDGDIVGENGLIGWEIILSGGASLTRLTGQDGCFTFAGLLPGNYTISEGVNIDKMPFSKTYPAQDLYDISLAKGQDITGMDFGNYLAVCGNNFLDQGEECDDGNTQDGDTCSSVCAIIRPSIPQATLTIIKQVINGNGGTATSSDFTINVSGTNVSKNSFPGSAQGTEVSLDEGDYSVSEENKTGYTSSLDNNCSGFIASGENKTCTIINTFIEESGGGGDGKPSIDLSVTKSVSSQSPNPGDTLTYQITALNNSAVSATNVSASDLLPPGLTFDSATSTLGTFDQTTGIWIIGDLTAGASATLLISVKVDENTAGQTITNSVVINSPDINDPNNANNTASASITIATVQIPGTPDQGNGGNGGGSGTSSDTASSGMGGGNGPIGPSDAYQKWLEQQAAAQAPAGQVAGSSSAKAPQGEVKGESISLPATGFDLKEGMAFLISLLSLIGLAIVAKNKPILKRLKLLKII